MHNQIETKIFSDCWDVDLRLNEFRLTRKGLLTVRAVAMNASANATPFHPRNSAGTFAYHEGSWGLRDQFVVPGSGWVEDCLDGIEAIRCDDLKIRIAFSNVDTACDEKRLPRPRSKKGPGAERVSAGGLFENLPHFAPRQSGEWALYYIMVDEAGATELSRPIVNGGTFVGATERLFLSSGGDEDGNSILSKDGGNDEGDADRFEPQIARR